MFPFVSFVRVLSTRLHLWHLFVFLQELFVELLPFAGFDCSMCILAVLHSVYRLSSSGNRKHYFGAHFTLPSFFCACELIQFCHDAVDALAMSTRLLQAMSQRRASKGDAAVADPVLSLCAGVVAIWIFDT